MLAASTAPSVVLMSCYTADVPAPTVSVSSAAKAASLALYRSLAIENPSIKFTYICPLQVRGTSFYDAPADGGKPRGTDPNRSGVSREAVADTVMTAVDKGKDTVFMPSRGVNSFFLGVFFPSFIARAGKKRFGYPAS